MTLQRSDLQGHIYHVWRVGVRLPLDMPDPIIIETESSGGAQLRFQVRDVTYNGLPTVAVRGPAITRKGDRGFIDRSAAMDFNDLPEVVKEEIRVQVARHRCDLIMHEGSGRV